MALTRRRSAWRWLLFSLTETSVDYEKEACIENDTGNGEAKPQTLHSSVLLECEMESQRQSQNPIAEQSPDRAVYLVAQASDDSALHTVQSVEKDIEHENVDHLHHDSYDFFFSGE